MQQFLSIITINYNNASGLKKTVESVISQTYKNFEFIVIDGSSSDDSYQYLETKKAFISYLISEKDTGIYNAMNKGIRAAKGEYLLFLNSGDVLNGNNALQNFIKNPHFSGDIVYGDYKFLKGEKKYPDLLTPLYFFKSSLPHQSSFIRRNLFEKFGFYDETFKIVSDKAFFLKCFLSNKVNFKHINYALSTVDLGGISNNAKNKEKVILENNIILKDHFGIFYKDYIKMIELESLQKILKRKTLNGYLIRIKSKIKHLLKR